MTGSDGEATRQCRTLPAQFKGRKNEVGSRRADVDADTSKLASVLFEQRVFVLFDDSITVVIVVHVLILVLAGHGYAGKLILMDFT